MGAGGGDGGAAAGYSANGTVVPSLDETDMDNIGDSEGWDRMEFHFSEPVQVTDISFSAWEANDALVNNDAADISKP